MLHGNDVNKMEVANSPRGGQEEIAEVNIVVFRADFEGGQD